MATETIDRTYTSPAAQSASRRATGLLGKINPEQVATGLGWFSVGLGLAELFAPRTMSRLAGARRDHSTLTRLFGLREIAAGAVIFSGARTAGCWSRVAGDILDLSMLAGTIAAPRTDKRRAIGSTAAVAGVTVLDALTAWELTRSRSGAYDIRLERAITINKSPEECYRFWHDFENLPRFMAHLDSVRTTGENRTHWIARGPGAAKVEWDAQVLNDRPNECISWRSLEGADIDHSGSVHFERAPGGRGAVVRVTMYYSPPAMGAGAAVAKLLGQDPEQAIAKDLRRFKQVMETGEVLTTKGQPAGRASGETWLDAIARF